MRERLSRDTEKLCEFSSMLSRRIKDIVTTKHDEAVCERVKPSSVTQSQDAAHFSSSFFSSLRKKEKKRSWGTKMLSCHERSGKERRRDQITSRRNEGKRDT